MVTAELGSLQPVEPDWVVGKALFAIPLLGYLPLNIIPVAIIIIVAMLLYELQPHAKGVQRNRPERNVENRGSNRCKRLICATARSWTISLAGSNSTT